MSDGECGAAMLELAFSAIIFLTFIFGLFSSCLALYTYHYISEAAREATRYAIVRGSTYTVDCTAPGPATCTAQGGINTGDIATFVQNIGFPGIDPSNIVVNSKWLTSTGAFCSNNADPCKAPGNQVQVQVKYNFPFVIPFIPSTTLTMSSTSQMVISN